MNLHIHAETNADIYIYCVCVRVCVCMTNMPARQQTSAKQQGNYAVIRPCEKANLKKRSHVLQPCSVSSFLCPWLVWLGMRKKPHDKKLSKQGWGWSDCTKKGQKGLACWYWWSMLCATRLKSRSISSTEPFKIPLSTLSHLILQLVIGYHSIYNPQ